MWLGEIQRKNLSQVYPRQLIGRVRVMKAR